MSLTSPQPTSQTLPADIQKKLNEKVEAARKSKFDELLKEELYNGYLSKLPDLFKFLKEAGLEDILFKHIPPNDQAKIVKLLDKKSLKDSIPDFATLTATLNILYTALDKASKSEEDLKVMTPVSKSFLIQSRNLMQNLHYNCSIARHVSNAKTIYTTPPYHPPKRKMPWYKVILCALSVKYRKNDELKHEARVSQYDQDYTNDFSVTDEIMNKVKKSVATQAGQVLNSYIYPVILGLETQLEASKVLDDLSVPEQEEKAKSKLAKLYAVTNAVAYAAKIGYSISSETVRFAYGTSYDYTGELLGWKKDEERMLQSIESDKEPSLNQHLKRAFDERLRAETFDILTEFARQIYLIYETGARFDENNSDHLPDKIEHALEACGFKRLVDDPDFKVMLVSMLDDLGFKVDPQLGSKNLLAYLCYLPQDKLNKIRQQFIESDKDTSALAKAKNRLFEEYQNLISDPKRCEGSENYLGLLSVHVRALEEVESKQRIANVSNLLPNLDDKINYNPAHTGFFAHVKHNARKLLTGHLQDLIGPLVKDVRRYRLEAQQLTTDYALSIQAQQSMWMQGPPKKARKDKATLSQREEEWGEALDQAKKQKSKEKAPSPGDTLDTLILGQFHKSWDKYAVATLTSIKAMTSDALYEELIKVVMAEIKELERIKARPEIIQSLSEKLLLYESVFYPGKKLHFKDYTHTELLALQEVVSLGTKKLLKTQYFANANVDEKQFLLLANQSLSNLGSAQKLPERVANVYNELVLTDRSKLASNESGILKKWCIEHFGGKLAQAMHESYSGPTTLLEYYVDQKQSGQYQLAPPPSPEVPQATQTWGEYFYSWGSTIAQTTGLATVFNKLYEYAGIATWVASYGVSGTKQTGAISYNTLSSWLQGKGKTDDKTLNEMLVNHTKRVLKEQTFDAFFDIMAKVYALKQTTKGFQSSHTSGNLKDNPFLELGLSRLKENDHILTEIAQSLGFKGLDELYYILGAPNGEAEVKKLRAAFADPKNEDSLARLKTAIATEHDYVVRHAPKKLELPHSSNYVTLISSMNTIVENVTFTQQVSKAAELYLPDAGRALGVDSKGTRLYDLLMNECGQKATEHLAKKGVAFMMQESIEQASAITSEILGASIKVMNRKLEEKYKVTPSETAPQTHPETPGRVTYAPLSEMTPTTAPSLPPPPPSVTPTADSQPPEPKAHSLKKK